MRIKITSMYSMCFILTACGQVSEQQKLEIAGIKQAAESKAEQSDVIWREALINALQNHRPTTENCTTKTHMPRQIASDLAVWVAHKSLAIGAGADHGAFSSHQIAIFYDAKKITTIVSPHHNSMSVALNRIINQQGKYKDMSGVELIEQATQQVNFDNWSWDLVILIGGELSAKKMDDKTFSSGAIVGATYLYDHQKQSVVCMGYLDATSSKSVSIWKFSDQEVDANAYLDADLTIKAIEAAMASLRQVAINHPD